MGWWSPPRWKHDEGVIDPDPEEEEWGSQVQSDELHLRQRDEDLDDEDLNDEDLDDEDFDDEDLDCCVGDLDDMELSSSSSSISS